MSQTAEERLLKRKINELEQDIKKLRRELDQTKSLKKQIGRLRKKDARAAEREVDLKLLEEDLTVERLDLEAKRPKEPERGGKSYKCRKCPSTNTMPLTLGPKILIRCLDCGAKYTLDNEDFEKEDTKNGETLFHKEERRGCYARASGA